MTDDPSRLRIEIPRADHDDNLVVAYEDFDRIRLALFYRKPLDPADMPIALEILLHAMYEIEWDWYDPQASKHCDKCWYIRPYDYFLIRRNKPTGICKVCRREREKQKEAKSRQDALIATNYDIRRTVSTEKLSRLLQNICDRLGGADKLSEEWVKLIQSQDVPDATRVKALSSLVDASKVCERARVADAKEANPVQLALEWHEKQQLVPLVRAFLDDGLITLDDIDPPPEEV